MDAGCADKLPITDESVDVVINIESSHFYPSMERFISEVRRILRPNGYLAFADLRHYLQVETLDKCFSESGLRILEKSDITPQVLSSLTEVSDRRKAHINSTYPIICQAAREMSWSRVLLFIMALSMDNKIPLLFVTKDN